MTAEGESKRRRDHLPEVSVKAVASTGLVGQIVAALGPQVLNPLLVRPGPVSNQRFLEFKQKQKF